MSPQGARPPQPRSRSRGSRGGAGDARGPIPEDTVRRPARQKKSTHRSTGHGRDAARQPRTARRGPNAGGAAPAVGRTPRVTERQPGRRRAPRTRCRAGTRQASAALPGRPRCPGPTRGTSREPTALASPQRLSLSAPERPGGGSQTRPPRTAHLAGAREAAGAEQAGLQPRTKGRTFQFARDNQRPAQRK